MDEAHLRLTTAYLKNVGNSQCITLLESKTIESRADLRGAVITCYDNHGSVVNEDHNVAKFFSGLSKKREREMLYNRPKTFGYPKPTCFKCGKIGHKATECHYSGSGSNSQLKPTEKSFTCFSCGQPGHISPNCPNKSR